LKDVRRLTRPVLGSGPVFLTEFSWFTLTHPNVRLKCLKTDQYCFSCNPYLTTIIILPHTCIKQLSRRENNPNVGHAVHCLVHITFPLRLAVKSITPIIQMYQFSVTCQGTKARTLLTKFVLQNFPYTFQRLMNCDNEGAHAVFP